MPLPTENTLLDTPAVRAGLTNCAFALGQLDGALRSLRPETEPLLAAALLARALSTALAEAGYGDAEAAFARWLPRGAPPPSQPHAVLGAGALIQVVLHQLERARWAPLAASVTLLRRAAPHLSAPAPGLSDDIEIARSVLDQAQTITSLNPAASIETALLRLASAVHDAGETPDFSRGRAELATLETPWGVRSYHSAGPRPHVWALSLVAGDALCAAGVLSRAVPLSGSILLGAVRSDLSPAERAAFLFKGVTSSAHALVRMIETCRAHHERGQAALARLRSTSKAPAVFAFLAGSGPLTRAQIAAGFSVSRQGADTIIQALETAELVRRVGSSIEAKPHSARGETVEGPAPILPPLASLAEVDEALAAIDALLTKTTPF